MRIFTFIVCCIVTSASVAAEPLYVAADSSMETALCISAATSDRLDFKQDLQHNRIRPSVVANKLQCNDQPIANFAFQAGNTAVSFGASVLVGNKGTIASEGGSFTVAGPWLSRVSMARRVGSASAAKVAVSSSMLAASRNYAIT